MRSSFIGDGGNGDNAADMVAVQMLDGDPLIVRVTGRLLFDTLTPLADALAAVDPKVHPRVILDLGHVPLADSSAMSLLVRTRAALAGTGGWLRLAAVQPMVKSVLQITNLTWILPVYRTAEAAAAD
ncbi:STAS domain-containing protein [Dactylosporangium sp. NPDC051541]|uniref:STAS domain-containing protein n=1 Tax=Dactylosporangium sp. NPDC051541 TaxID=3363977 RepID=UPI00378D3A75